MIRKLASGLGVVWWLCTPQKHTCALCGDRMKIGRMQVHLWVDHADGT